MLTRNLNDPQKPVVCWRVFATLHQYAVLVATNDFFGRGAGGGGGGWAQICIFELLDITQFELLQL